MIRDESLIIGDVSVFSSFLTRWSSDDAIDKDNDNGDKDEEEADEDDAIEIIGDDDNVEREDDK